MVSKKVMEIQTTFTYNSVSDEIGWLNPRQHRAIKPTIHCKKTSSGYFYEYCSGRGGKKYRVERIKEVLKGETHE